MSLVTLDRSHPDFQLYLRGRLSDGRRAIPQITLNPHSERESVTFRVLSVKELNRPALPLVWFRALRPQSLPRPLVPLLVIFAWFVGRGDLDPDLPWLIVLGLFFLHSALVLRNDIADHLSGADRVRPDRGSRALQNGWLTVDQMEGAAVFFTASAALCALPLVFVHPWTLVVTAVAALVAGLGFFLSGRSFKDFIAGEVGLFLLAGPLLLWGISAALGHPVPYEGWLWSVLWGWWVLLPAHALNLERLLDDRKMGPRSLAHLWGFDGSRRLLSFWIVVAVLGQAAWILAYSESKILWVGWEVMMLGGIRLLWILSKVTSPAGSSLARFRREAEALFALNGLLWTIAAAWELFS